MIYQLPSGKIINITVEQYLDLTDEDIVYMMSMNFGDYPTSPWYESSIFNKRKNTSEDFEEIDKSIDYHDDENEEMSQIIIIEEELFDEFPDIPDESIQD